MGYTGLWASKHWFNEECWIAKMVLRPAKSETEVIAALFQDFSDTAGHEIQPAKQRSE
jgi:hypothetical protein